VTAPPSVARSGNDGFRAFGRSVAISGDFAFVGEPNTVIGGRGGRGGGPAAPGVVHVFRQTGGAWKPAGELTAATSVGGDGFGASLAADGTTLFVGQVSPPPVAAPAGRGGGRAAQPAAPPPPDTAVGTVQLFRRGAT
jgi:hypothetical protein